MPRRLKAPCPACRSTSISLKQVMVAVAATDQGRRCRSRCRERLGFATPELRSAGRASGSGSTMLGNGRLGLKLQQKNGKIHHQTVKSILNYLLKITRNQANQNRIKMHKLIKYPEISRVQQHHCHSIPQTPLGFWMGRFLSSQVATM